MGLMNVLSCYSSPVKLKDSGYLFSGSWGVLWVFIFWLILFPTALDRGGFVYLGWGLMGVYALVALSLVLLLVCTFLRCSAISVSSASFIFVPWVVYLLWNVSSRSEAYWYAQGELMMYISAVVVFIVVSNLDDKALRWLLRGVVVVGVFCIIVGLVQKVINYSWHPIGGIGALGHSGRLTSVFGQPNTLACFINMLSAYSLFKMLKGEKWFTLYALLAFLGMWCIHDSGSRAGVITLVIVMVAVSYLSSKGWKRRLLAGGVMGLMFLLSYCLVIPFGGVIGERMSVVGVGMSSYGRKTFYAGAGAILSDYPLFGAGLSNYHLLWDRYFMTAWHSYELHAHSTYLELLCETGISGFFLLFGPIVLIVYRISRRRIFSKSPDVADLSINCSIVGLLAFGVHELVNFEVKVASVVWVAALFGGVLARDVSFKLEVNKALLALVVLGGGLFWVPLVFHAKSYYFSSIADAKLHRAEGFMKLGFLPVDQLDEAQGWYQAGLDSDSKNLAAMMGLARVASKYVYASSGKDEESLKESLTHYSRCIEMSPKSWMAYLEKGMVMGMSDEYRSESIECFNQAVLLAPDNLFVQMRIGEILILHGCEIEAARVLTDVVRRAPEFTKVYKDALLMLGELEVKQ